MFQKFAEYGIINEYSAQSNNFIPKNLKKDSTFFRNKNGNKWYKFHVKM